MFPTTRQQFTDKCLRALGYPVIEINVDDDQVGDRVDDAIQKYWTYHFDGVEKMYLKHQITANDIANNSIPLPDAVIGVKKILPLHGAGALTSSINMFDVRYQYMLNMLPEFTSMSYVDYEITMMHLEQLNFFFVGKPGIQFNKAQNTLKLEIDWTFDVAVNDWIIIDCFRLLDPDTYTDVWKDDWLFRYATALIKRQWGTNMKKFVGIQLPGGIILDGKTIYDEAVAEVMALEYELRDIWEEPPMFNMG
jgi:hypothetical protein